MKKNWFVWILSVLIVLPINAQQKKGLYVDSFSGAAQVKVVGASTWLKPTHKQSVTRLDSVRIPEQSKMTIVDALNGNIYPCDFAFTGTVNQCLFQVKDSQSKVLVALKEQIKANAFGKSKNTTHRVYGGATRTEDEEDRYNDSIACLALTTAHASQTPYPLLSLNTVEEDGMVHFIISNNGQKDYYVNILMLNTHTEEISMCIVPETDVAPEVLLLYAGQSLDLSMFHFLKQIDRRYILFATESPFIPAAIQPLLRYPEDLKCK